MGLKDELYIPYPGIAPKENAMESLRWREWARLILGVWLFLAPFLMSYGSFANAAARNCFMVGGAVAVVAGWVLPSHERWEEWVNLALGIWLVIAPFALDFYGAQEAAAWNQIIVGILISGAAIWTLAERPTHRTLRIMKNDGRVRS